MSFSPSWRTPSWSKEKNTSSLPIGIPASFFRPGRPFCRSSFSTSAPVLPTGRARFACKKASCCVRDRGILLIRYDLDRSPKEGLLRLKPFLAYRGYHGLAHANPYLRSRTEGIENGFPIEPYAGMPPLFIRTSASSRFTPSPLWYKRFEYTEERERGFDWEEDLFLPGIIEVPVKKEGTVILAVSCDILQHGSHRSGRPLGDRNCHDGGKSSADDERPGRWIHRRGPGPLSRPPPRGTPVSHHDAVGETGRSSPATPGSGAGAGTP